MVDRTELERRRFARLLGIDGGVGSGLPIGEPTSGGRRDPLERSRRFEGDT